VDRPDNPDPDAPDIPPPAEPPLDPAMVEVTPAAAPTVVPHAVPDGPGLTPGFANPIAPMGIPGGGTGLPAVLPSGEVAPTLGIVVPSPPMTCAMAAGQSKTSVSAIAKTSRFIVNSTVALPHAPARPVSSSLNISTLGSVTFSDLPRFVRCCDHDIKSW
jgi:hypothetical protein